MPADKKRPGSDRMPPPPGTGVRRKDITETEGWKTGASGFKRAWNNYKNLLKDNFNNMSREDQEDLIDKFAMIITIGVTVLAVLLLYQYIPRILRVLGLPVALIVAWWAGRKIVGPVVIDRMEHLLKKEDRRDRDDYQRQGSDER